MSALADRLERLIARDVGRNVGPLADAARGGLARAVRLLDGVGAVAILTGFYIPSAEPPGAETDGPIGAVFLAEALAARGARVRVVTDAPCAPVVEAAVGAGTLDCPVDVVAVDGFTGGEPLDAVRARLATTTHVIAIERCGPGADGVPRNARGEDVARHTAPLECLFQPPARRIAIGDGGNELGMGSLPLEVIAGAIAHGATVACRVPADALIVAGVSNWAGVALALLLGGRPDGDAHDRLLDAMLAAGAVDGITRRAARSVDGVPAAEHRAMVEALAREVRAG